MSSTYIPPLYTKFGKTNKDLFSKNFVYDHQIKTSAKSPSGLSIETTGIYTPAGTWRGNLKVAQKQVAQQGDAELSFSTDAAVPTTGTFTFNKYRGVLSKLDVTTRDKDRAFTGPTLTETLEYVRPNVASTLQWKSDSHKHKAEITVATGLNNVQGGFAVGGTVSLDVSNGADIADINVGAEYAAKQGTISVVSSKNADFINVYGVTRLPAKQGGQLVGVQSVIDVNNATRPTVAVAVEHSLNAGTLIKAKGEWPSQRVDVAIEHKLANPRVTVGLAAAFNAGKLASGAGSVSAEKFGIQLTLGD